MPDCELISTSIEDKNFPKHNVRKLLKQLKDRNSALSYAAVTSKHRQVTKMLDFAEGMSAHEKSYISVGQLPELVEDRQPPCKKPPFATISRHALVHTVRERHCNRPLENICLTHV
jgi:hypothetical protein